MRGYAETRHRAESWDRERRAVARIEATRLGPDIRFVVTNLTHGAPQWLFDSVYFDRSILRDSGFRHCYQHIDAVTRGPSARPIANMAR